MKRFLLFGGTDAHVHRGGGWNDYIAEYDTFEEALGSGERYWIGNSPQPWFQIVDLDAMTVLHEFYQDYRD